MKDAIEIFVIDRVKEKRIEKGYTQLRLAIELEVSSGFIGMVESNRYSHKYSLSQLNRIAQLFECSPRDFLPEMPL